MNDFVPMPNKGTMFLSKNKKHEKSPDFYGSIHVEKDYLIDLIKNLSSDANGLVEIKLSSWKGVTRNGDPWLSLAVDTFKREQQAPAPAKDPWEN